MPFAWGNTCEECVSNSLLGDKGILGTGTQLSIGQLYMSFCTGFPLLLCQGNYLWNQRIMYVGSQMNISSYLKNHLSLWWEAPLQLSGLWWWKMKSERLGFSGQRVKLFLIKEVSGFWHFSCYVSVALLVRLGLKTSRAELWALLLAHGFGWTEETWQNHPRWKPKARATCWRKVSLSIPISAEPRTPCRYSAVSPEQAAISQFSWI